jgi:hypothetical protein
MIEERNGDGSRNDHAGASDWAGLALTLDRLRADEALVDHFVYLVGRPPLKDFTWFVTEHGVDGQNADAGALAEEWRAASRYVRELQKQEKGVADDAVIEPLPRHLEPLRGRLFEDPLFRRAFNTVPTDVGLVELDRLVVYQKFVNLSHREHFRRGLGADRTDADVFRACLPFEHPQPTVRWVRTHRNEFVFVSPSNDIRFLESTVLEPDQITSHPQPGAVAGVVALTVGFGSNFLNVIHCDDRLILSNGTHRAYCLREMGYTHVPCIIQHVSNREELEAAASGDLRRSPDTYLRQARPSMFKDYFDPRLHRIVPVPRRLRQIRVKFDIDESDVPAL